MHGVQAIANAIPATSGPPLPARAISASTCHSRFRRATNRLATNRTPMAMITAPAIFSSVSRWSWSVCPSPVAVSPSRMKMVEKLATKTRLGTSTRRQLAPLELADGDAGDGREVAGDQRQDAGREERDEPGAERRQDADARCRIALHRRTLASAA